ncbi:MAG TPA: hypothetical protein VFK06_10125 [Candidatus Angelobacter sp.]|nr:hypothetical protein [Candidatus Angelobacter sp.]
MERMKELASVLEPDPWNLVRLRRVCSVFLWIIWLCCLLASAQNSSTSDKPTKKPVTPKSSSKACGQTLPLNIEGMKRLRLIPRLSSLVDTGGFTQQEFDSVMSHDRLQDQAAQIYGFAYVMWKKPLSRDQISEMIDKSFKKSLAANRLSLVEKAQLDTFLPKYKNMMIQAFDMGSVDANRMPCPF